MKKIFKVIKWIAALLGLLLIAGMILLYRSDIPIDQLKTKYTNEHSRFMPLMGMQVHYRDEGNPNDTLPLVLIHGTSASLHTWDSLVIRLKDKKRVISMDLPAFGLTGANPERDYSMPYYNRFVDSLLIKLGVQQCIIAGNSLGGSIAWNQALYSSDKIAGLILIDAGGYPKKKEKGNIGFKLASMPVVGNILAKFTPKALIRKSLEDVYSDDSKISTALEDRYFDLLLREGNRKATIDIFRQRAKPTPEKIKQIHIPTLIIWGEEDQLIDVSNAYLFNQDIKGSRMLIIKKSGHVPMEETPEAVYQSIKNFIDQ
jgi:pimeloyl-ACP methyl ester carboxylesterase